MVTEREIAWAAGLFEGEGSITTQNNANSERMRVRFTMAMTDRDVMERFHAIVGCGTLSGPTRRPNSWKDIWRWHASTPEEVAILAELFCPYLGERRLDTLERCLMRYEGQSPRRNARSEKTHCPRGHPYSGDNLILQPTKWGHSRRCRECERQRAEKKNAAKRAAHTGVADVAEHMARIEAGV